MRYHLFKSSKTKFILITDSQRRHFESENLNILSLPGATIKDVYNFLPPINQYCKNILFFGGNDLYNGCKPSDKTPIDIANQLIEFANFLNERTKEVYLIGIPERNENKQRSAAVNEILVKVSHRSRIHKPSVNWKYRESVSIYQALNTSILKIIFTLTNVVAQTFTTLSNKRFCTRIIT